MVSKIQLGYLLVVLLSCSAYIVAQEEVKFKVGEYKTSICIWGGDGYYDLTCGKGWIRGGDEYSKLFRGTTRVYANSREVLETFDGNKTNFTRVAITNDGPTLIDNYVFDGDKYDKEKVPVARTATVTNGGGLFFQVDFKNLKCVGGMSRSATSPESFGNNIQIEWEGEPHIHKIYKYKYRDICKLTLKWRVESDYEVYKFRMFDPFNNCPGEINSTNSPYTMTSDLESNSTCFTIGDDDVIIDGAGFTVNYSMLSLGYGVNNTDGYDNITIKNIRFTQPRGGSSEATYYSYVISTTGMTDSLIDNITVNNIGRFSGLNLWSGSNNVNITNSDLTYTASAGTYGVWISGSDNVQIEDTNITSSASQNIYVTNSDSLLVSNCEIWNKNTNWVQPIVFADSSSNSIIISNNLTASGHGIHGNGINMNISWNNITISSSGGENGIDATSISSGTIEGNTIITTTDNSVGISGCSSLTIEGNTIITSGLSANGLECTSSNTIQDNTITVSGGTTSANDPSAIKITGNSNLVLNNDAYATGTYGTGCEIGSGTNNNFTGGTCSASAGRDYFLVSSGTTNNFTDTNFSGTRRVYFSTGNEWFNYNNNSNDVFIKTNMSTASANTYFDRELLSFDSIHAWNDTNQSGAFELGYELIGLSASVNYLVKNSTYGTTSTNPHTADSDGTISSFYISLIDETTINITDSTTIYFNSSMSYDYFEIPTMINISVDTYEPGNTMCLSIDHPDYGTDYICGVSGVESNITIMPTLIIFNTSSIDFNLTSNSTAYLNFDKQDIPISFALNLTNNNGTMSELAIYVNNSKVFRILNSLVVGAVGVLNAFDVGNTTRSVSSTSGAYAEDLSLYFPRNVTVTSGHVNINSTRTNISSYDWKDEITAGYNYIYIGDTATDTVRWGMFYYKPDLNIVADKIWINNGATENTYPTTLDFQLCLVDSTTDFTCNTVLRTTNDFTMPTGSQAGVNVSFSEIELVGGLWYGFKFMYDSDNDGTADIVDADSVPDSIGIMGSSNSVSSSFGMGQMDGTTETTTSQIAPANFITQSTWRTGLFTERTPMPVLRIGDSWTLLSSKDSLSETGSGTKLLSILDAADDESVVHRFNMDTSGYPSNIRLSLKYGSSSSSIKVEIYPDANHNVSFPPVVGNITKISTTQLVTTSSFTYYDIEIDPTETALLVGGQTYLIKLTPETDCFAYANSVDVTSFENASLFKNDLYDSEYAAALWFNITYYNESSLASDATVSVSNSLFNDKIGACTLSEQICNMESYFGILTNGTAYLSNIEINYTFNPIEIAASYLDDYLVSASGSSVDIPISFNGTFTNATVTIHNISFYGAKDYTIIANYTGDAVTNTSATRTLGLRYSNYTADFPYESSQLVFWLNSVNETNATPVGQSSWMNGTTFNFTRLWDWDVDIGMGLNQSLDSCLDLMVDNDTSEFIMTNSLQTVITTNPSTTRAWGVNYRLNASSCNRTDLGVYAFYPWFDVCCSECYPCWD